MASFCPGCGSSVVAEDKFCRVCGRAAFPDSAVIPASAPVGPGETSGKAIASLLFGLLFLFTPFAIAAVIFGHLSLSEIRQSAGRLTGHGMAIAGLLLGYAGVAALPVILIVAAIAIPNLLRARMAANESSAVAAVRTLNVAEEVYSQTHPATGYTCALSDLDQVDSTLRSGRKSGYVFGLRDCAAGAEGTSNVKYRIVAYPVTPNQTGVRAFCSDESAVIRFDPSGSAQGCMESGSALQ